MGETAIKVVIDDEHMSNADFLEKELKSLGMTVEQVIPEIGVVFGTISDDILLDISKLHGVIKVGKEETFQLPPLTEEQPQ